MTHPRQSNALVFFPVPVNAVIGAMEAGHPTRRSQFTARESSNGGANPAFTSFIDFLLEDAMERELTPVEARGGVVSGRVITVLAISCIGAVIALAGIWAIIGLPT